MKKIFFIALFLNLISINQNINSSCDYSASWRFDRNLDGSCNDEYDCGVERGCYSGKCGPCQK